MKRHLQDLEKTARGMSKSVRNPGSARQVYHSMKGALVVTCNAEKRRFPLPARITWRFTIQDIDVRVAGYSIDDTDKMIQLALRGLK